MRLIEIIVIVISIFIAVKLSYFAELPCFFGNDRNPLLNRSLTIGG